ncbi:Ethylene insensitive 3 family protein [Rhynchospora pubera]|uniref:Ethylene insensitive 3 family protein n=1 Tax=Rhynchospora pubera TaxID=906938 RepID=A0AAV8CBJ6_9POAL|nr:Ethylene insensitive 3 family protein [Rhynchospora pubera]
MDTSFPDELISFPIETKKSKLLEEAARGLHSSNHDFSVPSVSNSNDDSESEEIEIFELKRRMWKDQMLLSKLQAGTTSNEADADGRQSIKCSHLKPLQPNRKTLLRAEDGVLHYMLKMMRDCDARGFVYGILPHTGAPVAGSSDSLRAWWKDTVKFEKNAPLSLQGQYRCDEHTGLDLDSYLHKLQDMNDNTIGSILSALIQHWEPPQRIFPFDQGTPPPWWPTGKEMWWGLQGRPQALLGPPPYRKPHDLRKGWKLSVLAAVIKHMSPRFEHMRSLVWQSKRLQYKMSAKDVDTWSMVLNQEEVLAEQTKKSLVITPIHKENDGGGNGNGNADYVGDRADTRKRKWGFENGEQTGSTGNEKYCLEEDLLSGIDSWPVADLDMNSIEELMKLYPQESAAGAGADFGVPF